MTEVATSMEGVNQILDHLVVDAQDDDEKRIEYWGHKTLF